MISSRVLPMKKNIETGLGSSIEPSIIKMKNIITTRRQMTSRGCSASSRLPCPRSIRDCNSAIPSTSPKNTTLNRKLNEPSSGLNQDKDKKSTPTVEHPKKNYLISPPGKAG